MTTFAALAIETAIQTQSPIRSPARGKIPTSPMTQVRILLSHRSMRSSPPFTIPNPRLMTIIESPSSLLANPASRFQDPPSLAPSLASRPVGPPLVRPQVSDPRSRGCHRCSISLIRKWLVREKCKMHWSVQEACRMQEPEV
jgi:hypothetical protein